MKKKVFSIILTVTMLVSLLSFFSLSAGAEDAVIAEVDGYIDIPNYTYYHEEILTGLTVNETYYFALSVPKEGHVLVQSFGPTAVYAPGLTLYNYNLSEVICQDSYAGRDFKTKGYNRKQTLFQFYSDGEIYLLKVVPRTSGDIRLSFTLAEDYFDGGCPIDTYNDIIDMEDGILQVYWTPGTHAVVGCFTPNETRRWAVTTSGSVYMESYILNPRTNEIYADYPIPGETDGQLYLEGGLEYYIVMFIPDGELTLEPTMLSIIIS